MTDKDPFVQSVQQVARHANKAGLSVQDFAKAMNNMTNPNPPPLWEAIAEACANHPDGVVDLKPAVIQAMIRAARDWLVPEEEPPHRGMRPGGTNLTHQEKLSVERQRLRAVLTAEAERAEKGE